MKGERGRTKEGWMEGGRDGRREAWMEGGMDGGRHGKVEGGWERGRMGERKGERNKREGRGQCHMKSKWSTPATQQCPFQWYRVYCYNFPSYATRESSVIFRKRNMRQGRKNVFEIIPKHFLLPN